MNELTFDGITFRSENELINFLKQSYYAHKSTIRVLEVDRDKFRSLQQSTQQTADPKIDKETLEPWKPEKKRRITLRRKE